MTAPGYQLQIRGHEDLVAKLTGTDTAVRPAMVSSMHEATALILTTAVTRYLSGPPGLNRRTGRLAAGVEADVQEKGDVVEGTVGTNVEHGLYQEMPEDGAGVVVIRPRVKKVLAWVTSGTRPQTPDEWKQAREEGRVVYAKQVTLKRHAFLKPARDTQEDAVNRLFANKLTKLVGGG